MVLFEGRPLVGAAERTDGCAGFGAASFGAARLGAACFGAACFGAAGFGVAGRRAEGVEGPSGEGTKNCLPGPFGGWLSGFLGVAIASVLLLSVSDCRTPMSSFSNSKLSCRCSGSNLRRGQPTVETRYVPTADED